MSKLTVEAVAKVCHNVNKAFCESVGDNSQVDWDDAPEWQKYSAIDGVVFHFKNPTALPSSSHDNWLREKEGNGWLYGPNKDAELKQHPCIVSYKQLPIEQQSKDYIFREICHSLKPFSDYWEDM